MIDGWDIVSRLRDWDDQQPPFVIMAEAADEIEQLRGELATAKRTPDAVTDDVTDRLRAAGWPLMAEAATEIERLREIVRNLQADAVSGSKF
jgi:CheY-like chemotaxis protein